MLQPISHTNVLYFTNLRHFEVLEELGLLLNQYVETLELVFKLF